MEQILLAYGFPKETVSAIMVPYKNIKAMVHSPDGNPNFFNTVTGVLQRDPFTPYLFIPCRNYILQMSVDWIKENGCTLKRWEIDNIPEKQINTDCADDLALLVNIPAQAESLLLCREPAAEGVGLYVNANKTNLMCFKWVGASPL